MGKEEITNIPGKANLLEKQKMNMEAAKDDAGFYDAIKDANKQIAKNQEKQEDLMEELEKAKELENEAKMNQEMMNNYLQDSDQEDLDDELDDIMNQMNNEEALKMEQQFSQNDKNIIQPTPAQPQKQAKKDDVDDMFAQLMSS